MFVSNKVISPATEYVRGGVTMGLMDLFSYEDPGIRIECSDCGETFVVQRSDERVCPECGSTDVEYLGPVE